jgi:PAS domain S-box-containing protein
MSEQTRSRQGNGKELERLKRRCEELEFLLEQYLAQAEEWREVTQVVWALYGSYKGLIILYQPGSNGDAGSIISANDTTCQALGYPKEEVPGMALEAICLPGHREALSEALHEAMTENGSVAEVDLVTRDGGQLPVELSLSRYLIRGKHRILFVGRDVTERQASEEALRASEERYRTLVENINDVLFTIDTGGCFTYISPVIERVSGYRQEEIVGKSLALFMHPDEYDELMGGLVFEEDGTQPPRELRIIDKGGGSRYVRTSGRLIVENGEVVGLTGNMTDITREKAYEQTLEESARRLRDFLSVASHELRHPITIIKGYAQLMSSAMGEMPEEKARAIFESIERNIDHLYRLGDELLDVARIEEERFTVRRRVVDPVRLVREVVEEMRARGYHGDLEVDIDPGLGKVKMDRDKIKRLLIILLENAFKYSPAPREVQVKARREGEEAVFEVLDRGPGVPAGEEKKIFERFYQVDDVFHHSKPGIGLGLYIGREIAHAHGGRIWYEQRPDGGSAFRFALPQE